MEERKKIKIQPDIRFSQVCERILEHMPTPNPTKRKVLKMNYAACLEYAIKNGIEN